MTAATTYAVHPLADLLPAMTADEFANLKQSVETNGQRVRIVLFEGKVLDGRHRVRACDELGIAPLVETYTGDNPAAHVLALNVQRRHLSRTQRAMLATTFLPALREEAKERQGTRTDLTCAPRGAQVGGKVRASDQAAQIVGVAARTVERAARIVEQAPDLAERVTAGAMSIKAADTELREREAASDAKPQTTGNARGKGVAGLDTGKGQTQAAAHLRRLRNVESQISGMCMGIPHLNVDHIRALADPDEIDQINRSLGNSIAVLRKLRTELERKGA